jgi:hypothetical protein
MKKNLAVIFGCFLLEPSFATANERIPLDATVAGPKVDQPEINGSSGPATVSISTAPVFITNSSCKIVVTKEVIDFMSCQYLNAKFSVFYSDEIIIELLKDNNVEVELK